MRIRPSDLRTMAFCPRLLFFEMHLKKEVTLSQRLRMLLGKLWHALVEMMLPGESEVVLKGEVGGFEVIGRADTVSHDAVIELKSGKGPRDGAWYGDYLQALTYAVLTNKDKVIIKYRNKEVVIRIGDEDKEELVEALKMLSMIAEGYLPPPKKNSWCSKCPYKEMCAELGDEWDQWFGRMPWVKRA